MDFKGGESFTNANLTLRRKFICTQYFCFAELLAWIWSLSNGFPLVKNSSGQSETMSLFGRRQLGTVMLITCSWKWILCQAFAKFCPVFFKWNNIIYHSLALILGASEAPHTTLQSGNRLIGQFHFESWTERLEGQGIRSNLIIYLF